MNVAQSDPPDPVTAMLEQATQGDAAAAADLLPKVYGELRAVASRYLAKESRGHTLQPTALVHEACARLLGSERAYHGRPHILAAAAIAMRRVLVDHARKHHADKRDAGARVTLHTEAALAKGQELQVLELDDLLCRLALLDSRKARVVELRFFAAMTNEEIAAALGVARSTVAEDWAVARAWLASQLAV